jgi:hypothetical protein
MHRGLLLDRMKDEGGSVAEQPSGTREPRIVGECVDGRVVGISDGRPALDPGTCETLRGILLPLSGCVELASDIVNHWRGGVPLDARLPALLAKIRSKVQQMLSLIGENDPQVRR